MEFKAKEIPGQVFPAKSYSMRLFLLQREGAYTFNSYSYTVKPTSAIVCHFPASLSDVP